MYIVGDLWTAERYGSCRSANQWCK